MRKKRNRLTVLTAMCLVFCLTIGGCGKKTPSEQEKTQSKSGSESGESVLGVPIIRDGNTDYMIVIPDGADEAIVNAASNLRAAFAKLAPIKDFITDFDYRHGQVTPKADDHMILLGDTCLPQSKTAREEIGFGDFVLKVDGTAIVVNGWESSAVVSGVTELIRVMKTHTNGQNLTLPQDLCTVREVNPTVNAMHLERIGGTRSGLSDSGNGGRCVTVTEIDQAGVDAYISELKSIGYQAGDVNTVDGLTYRNYLSDAYLLHLLYTDAEQTLRIIAESRSGSALPPTEAENVYSETVPSLAISVSIELTDICDTKNGTGYNGMCYIYRLADGSFLVWDGGWDQPEQGERIYSVLQKYAPDPDRITVAAWILTHPHSDHIGGFINFANRYTKKGGVAVERVIYSLPSSDFQSQTKMSQNVSKLTSAARATGAKVTQAHPGQVFHFRNAKLEILWTLDLYDKEKLDEVNTSSIVSRLELAGQSFLMLGDMSFSAKKTIMQVYGDALKSDFVQVAHHGADGGGSVDFYEKVGARYVLWPASTLLYEGGRDANGVFKGGVRNAAQNRLFLNMEIGKDLFIAGAENYVIPLPYAGENAVSLPKNAS